MELQDDRRCVSTLPSARRIKLRSVQFWKKWPRGIERRNGREHAMNTHPTLPSSPTKGPIFFTTLTARYLYN